MRANAARAKVITWRFIEDGYVEHITFTMTTACAFVLPLLFFFHNNITHS